MIDASLNVNFNNTYDTFKWKLQMIYVKQKVGFNFLHVKIGMFFSYFKLCSLFIHSPTIIFLLEY